MSATSIDKLGERMRQGPIAAEDLRQLNDFRRSFAPASSEVVRVLRHEFQLDPTARDAKSIRSILANLGRSTCSAGWELNRQRFVLLKRRHAPMMQTWLPESPVCATMSSDSILCLNQAVAGQGTDASVGAGFGEAMIHLVDDDWKLDCLVSITPFADEDRTAAQDARLRLELDLLTSKQDREVVLLQAESEAALRLTHQRYFLAVDEATAAVH